MDSYKGIYKPSICLIHSKCYKRMALHVKEKHKNVSDIKAFKQKNTGPPVLVVIPKYEEPSFEGFDSADDGEEMLIDEPNVCFTLDERVQFTKFYCFRFVMSSFENTKGSTVISVKKYLYFTFSFSILVIRKPYCLRSGFRKGCG